MLLCYSLQRNKNRTDELQRCIEKRLESLNDTVMSLRNEVGNCSGVVLPKVCVSYVLGVD